MRRPTAAVIAALTLLTIVAGATAMLLDGAGSCPLAQNSACPSPRRAAHNQCPIATKGSASCDAQFHSCLQGCLKR